ncbi:chemotaxis protein CheW [Aureimonas phyllosphaerae]|uniref:Purine-binding chemotaxis protein CheW n=1 Tax=Aureimonas phyllosphaerae TaxID=1166078 RepID=A0A7W6FUY2_9HYPH|nr:chemotaxis protein CheW [Aureimonas phyllosphaerae]MBB3936240.1 purine-binding chemotaxis protein CheW [Aureimonas phyllosphaerae]MBB3960035.1 purine-binding chemotaxis protein CheW [Aureimonas phyllosphaerae]SFF32541.1 CheW protein [Aureimonas phyllosphaerae]
MTQAPAAAPDLATAAPPVDFLTVSLGQDVFALAVEAVHEVLDPPPVTTVPNAPAFAPGLVNVRGNIMPLIDLRRRFAMPAVADTESSRVIVSRVETGGEGFFVAIKADAVHEVVSLDRAAVEPVPENGTRWPLRFLRGVVRHGGGFVVLLDLETVLQPDPASLPN